MAGSTLHLNDNQVPQPDSGQANNAMPMYGTRLAVQRASGFKAFKSNLHDFFFERPIKIRGDVSSPFQPAKFGETLGNNLKEWFRPLPASARGPVRSGMLVNWTSNSGSLWSNLRTAFGKSQLPKGAKVPEIWTKDTQYSRVQALSLAIHVVVLVLILVPLLPEIMAPRTTQAGVVSVVPLEVPSPVLPKLPPGNKRAGGGGGGGEHNPVPASKGILPKFSYTQLAPPSVHPPLDPKLQVPATIVAVPDIKIPNPNLPNYGDPMAKLLTDSNGPGGGGGIGSGQGTGVGSGDGAGYGPGHGWNTGGGYPRAGENGFGTPDCLYCPPPQFSDEAVKAKYQGVVTLMCVIMPDGRATDIHVAQGPGLGLEEKAIEAVRAWRFRPALGPDGKPAAVRMPIEVTFRLY